MKKKFPNTVVLAIILISASVSIYFVHFLIFRDLHHIFLYLVGDLAFMFLDVLVVVVVIERILTGREKQAMLYKLNMVIGAFFNEVGTKLLFTILASLEKKQEIISWLLIDKQWTHRDFQFAQKNISDISDTPNMKLLDLSALKALLVQKRPFFVQLITNPSVLENERSAELLWAIFHLEDELETRENIADLPKSDLDHIGGDIYRVYRLLAIEWLNYAEHLKNKYPYLFSLLVRINPAQSNPSAIVR
jgi:hypothetical protein